jgi:hypothetical protein
VIHVYRCQDKEVKELWRKNIYELEQQLKSCQTSPDIILQLVNGLLHWQDGTLQGTVNLITKQSIIGWNGILEDCLGLHWLKEQETYYSTNSIKKNGLGWAQLVIRKMWKIAWNM